jgi:hypothetical protein
MVRTQVSAFMVRRCVGALAAAGVIGYRIKGSSRVRTQHASPRGRSPMRELTPQAASTKQRKAITRRMVLSVNVCALFC